MLAITIATLFAAAGFSGAGGYRLELARISRRHALELRRQLALGTAARELRYRRFRLRLAMWPSRMARRSIAPV